MIITKYLLRSFCSFIIFTLSCPIFFSRFVWTSANLSSAISKCLSNLSLCILESNCKKYFLFNMSISVYTYRCQWEIILCFQAYLTFYTLKRNASICFPLTRLTEYIQINTKVMQTKATCQLGEKLYIYSIRKLYEVATHRLSFFSGLYSYKFNISSVYIFPDIEMFDSVRSVIWNPLSCHHPVVFYCFSYSLTQFSFSAFVKDPTFWN